MAILDKEYDQDDSELSQPATNGHSDAPPSYETISPTHSGQLTHLVDEKLPRQSTLPTPRSSSSDPSSARVDTPPHSVSGHSRAQPGPSSWLPKLCFTSSRTSKQVQQTVTVLIRDLVLNAESPNLLGSCADACRKYGLDLSALLQEPSIESHSAIYWAILNRHDALLPSLLVHASPLSKPTMSDIRLACLTTSNQHLFQSLRCQREPFTRKVTPLSTGPSADALILGSMPPDEVSIREMEGQGAFVAEIQINLWQKRMRVCGRVNVEFIARGRIWSLIFFSSSSTTHTAAGVWKVALSLLEHSPPTFIDSILVIDVPPLSSNMPTPPMNASQTSELISLSSLPDDASGSATRSPPSSSPPLSDRSKSKSKAPQPITVCLKSNDRLGYRTTFLDAALSSWQDWSPPKVERWSDNDDRPHTNVIIVPLDDGACSELMYGDTPYIAVDGTLHVRLEARLVHPGTTECVIC